MMMPNFLFVIFVPPQAVLAYTPNIQFLSDANNTRYRSSNQILAFHAEGLLQVLRMTQSCLSSL